MTSLALSLFYVRFSDFVSEELAERVGFEPTVAKGYTRSPGAPDRPLQHLSTIYGELFYIL